MGIMHWLNSKLVGSEHVVKDLSTDFRSGVVLCALLEVLTEKTIDYIRLPTADQYAENIQIGMSVMMDAGMPCTHLNVIGKLTFVTDFAS